MDGKIIMIICLIFGVLFFSILGIVLLNSSEKELSDTQSKLTSCQSQLLQQDRASKDSSIEYRNCEEALFNCKHGVK